MARTLIALSVALAVLAAACGPKPETTETDYVFVWLKTGPKSGQYKADESKAIFAGHMANIEKLASERKLIIAGPFDPKRHDLEDRGVFVFDVPTVEEARQLVETDPGVKAGEFRYVAQPLRSSITLRRLLDLENERKAQAQRDGRKMGMEDMRAYQLVTVKHMAAAAPTLSGLENAGKVIWAGHLGGDLEGSGLVVVDAANAQDAEEILGPAVSSYSTFDTWWSTKSLEGLRGLRAGR